MRHPTRPCSLAALRAHLCGEPGPPGLFRAGAAKAQHLRQGPVLGLYQAHHGQRSAHAGRGAVAEDQVRSACPSAVETRNDDGSLPVALSCRRKLLNPPFSDTSLGVIVPKVEPIAENLVEHFASVGPDTILDMEHGCPLLWDSFAS